MARPALSLILLLLLAAAPAGANLTEPTTAPATPSLAELLKATGLQYAETGQNAYTVTVAGRQTPQHKLFIASYEGLVLVGTVVARKADVPKDPQLATKLLRFNHDFDRVKVALDEDEDLIVRVDLTLRVLDADELRSNINQVAASADEILTLLQGTAGK